jgi:ferredoxin/predicted transcriptional regulator
MDELYEQLRRKLDTMAVGFPETKDKIEIAILKRLFSEKDAELFLHLSAMPEKVDDIAKRTNRDSAELAIQLESMAKAGLLFRVRRDNSVRYSAVPYVVGIFEFQLGKMDKESAKLIEQYYQEAFGKVIQSNKTPVMRTVPINKSVAVKWPVAPYEDVIEIIKSQKTIAIANCICRTTSELADKGCDHPKETCFMFGHHADYYVENEMARYIDVEEAITIVKRNDSAGLVNQPFNSQNAGGMCSCCGCSCGVLRSLKMQPSPAAAVQSNYYAHVISEECASCEACIARCHMDAISMVGDYAFVDKNRCIGCGLCVTECSTEALELIKKEIDQLYIPPKTSIRTYMQIEAERGMGK